MVEVTQGEAAKVATQVAAKAAAIQAVEASKVVTKAASNSKAAAANGRCTTLSSIPFLFARLNETLAVRKSVDGICHY